MEIEMESNGAKGFQVLWGSSPQKLYHSYLTYEKILLLGALVKDRNYYVRVYAFNEFGITEGVSCTLC